MQFLLGYLWKVMKGRKTTFHLVVLLLLRKVWGLGPAMLNQKEDIMVKALLLLGSTVLVGARLFAYQGDVDLSAQQRGVMAAPTLLTALQQESQGKNISWLSFEGQTSVTDSFLQSILSTVSLPRLNMLNLNNTSVTDVGVQALLNSNNTAVQSTAPLGVSSAGGSTPTFVLQVSAKGTAVDISTFHRQIVPCTLLAPVSPGTHHLPLGAHVGEAGLSFTSVSGQKRVAVTK